MRIPHLPQEWNWSWGFGLFIALPALALALLGLRAVRAERIEREQQLQEQQAQVARLIDAAISNRMAALEMETRQRAQDSDAPNEATNGIFAFSLEPTKLLRFPNQRVCFGDQPPPEWPSSIENLIEQALAAKAQGRGGEALVLYRRIGSAEPKLDAWAKVSVAEAKREAGQTDSINEVANLELSNSEATTPTGLPVALLACAYLDQTPDQDPRSFSNFFKRTIESLRSGRWWLSFDERSFYDNQLRRMIARAGGEQLSEDRKLKQLAAIEQIVRRTFPTNDSRSFESAQGESFLILWSKTESGSTVHDGLAFPQDRLTGLFDSVLLPLLSGQPFSVGVRDAEGHSVWGNLQGNAVHTEPLRGTRGLELVFSGLNGSRWLDPKQLLWLGFILLLVLTMAPGLMMTARLVRREVELGRVQNEFIAAMSHEFKSPIASIRLLMERITSGRLDAPETTADYHDAINREAERLERLVNRLLEWQQIQAGRRRYNFSSASLADVSAAAIKQMLPQADAKAIKIETEAEAKLPEVRLDEVAMTDAIENLIDNAIKYSAPDSLVKLKLRSENGAALVEVSDQGIGIDPDELPRIFEKFYRARRGDLQNVHGTGLGLALVKATVEAHGGIIEVETKPGVGSCFRLRLPISNGVPKDGANPDS